MAARLGAVVARNPLSLSRLLSTIDPRLGLVNIGGVCRMRESCLNVLLTVLLIYLSPIFPNFAACLRDQ